MNKKKIDFTLIEFCFSLGWVFLRLLDKFLDTLFIIIFLLDSCSLEEDGHIVKAYDHKIKE